jgi:hypothetical protein
VGAIGTHAFFVKLFRRRRRIGESGEQVKELLSHSIPNGDTGDIFEKLLAHYLEKKKSTATVAVNPDQKLCPSKPAGKSSSENSAANIDPAPENPAEAATNYKPITAE